MGRIEQIFWEPIKTQIGLGHKPIWAGPSSTVGEPAFAPAKKAER